MKTRYLILCALGALSVWLALDFNAPARTMPDAGDPLGFFTTVADKMLRSTFPFGITDIPVCSNGVYVYTPAVQRLLQLSANLDDAANTNFFPSVFRPLFATDSSNNLFIIGYQQVTNVSGLTDPQLSPPYDVTQLSAFNGTPIADTNGPVNVYGVPWIIGAKKGLPNFNQLYLLNAVTVTRKLQVLRDTLNPATASYATNQMYVMSMSNSLGVSFWNPYNSAYPRPLVVYASDSIYMTLTNGVMIWPGYTNFSYATIIENWPGSQWSGTPPNATPNPGSFCNFNWSFSFLSPCVYRFSTSSFDPVGSPTSSNFETTTPPLPQLPQFGFNTTNYLQAFILDGSNVIDYVQLRGPVNSGGLNQALADPDYPDQSQIHYQWSTNYYANQPPTPYGVINQLMVSANFALAPASGGKWSSAATPMGLTTPPAEAAYYEGFFVPSFQMPGGPNIYVNSLLSIPAPYTPTRTVFTSFLLQANDPLVHYLASDLNSQNGALAIWAAKQTWRNGLWYHSDDPGNQPLPQPPANPIGGRYQPWGQNGLMARLISVDTNTYNLAYKDPLVWGPDYWDFPTNLLSNLGELGQVHRGTPWQTIYLKSTNILSYPGYSGNQGAQNVGSNTWANWTGDIQQDNVTGQYLDAALMAPVSDWRLAGLLMSLLNTNDPTRLFSVNDSNLADWQNLLNGLTVYSNSAATPFPTAPPQFDTYVMASNSPQTWVLANGVANVKASLPEQIFCSIGDVLAASELTLNSPWLNRSGFQVLFGITDAEYEAIPAQLLPLLRPDSIGTLSATNSGWNLCFSGADGYDYALQTSTNLVNWEIVNTNHPVQGSFRMPVPAISIPQTRFYRSVLLP